MNEADKHLLLLIRSGEPEGWSQFVARFQARLLAFAARQVTPIATAEDLVQDTFIGFLQSLPDYRQQCELESLLFQILRRRIVDHYRRMGQPRELRACDAKTSDDESWTPDPLSQVVSRELSASEYLRRDEQQQADETALASAIEQLANELRDEEKFRDLKIAEGLFYAQLRSVDLAGLIAVTENEIAVVKRRLIERLARSIKKSTTAVALSPDTATVAADSLTSVWEAMRPSCPKRTTLGKYTLGILPANWEDFVRFHVESLGCTYCLANLGELQLPADAPEAAIQQQRMFNSTIGFLNRRLEQGSAKFRQS